MIKIYRRISANGDTVTEEWANDDFQHSAYGDVIKQMVGLQGFKEATFMFGNTRTTFMLIEDGEA